MSDGEPPAPSGPGALRAELAARRARALRQGGATASAGPAAPRPAAPFAPAAPPFAPVTVGPRPAAPTPATQHLAAVPVVAPPQAAPPQAAPPPRSEPTAADPGDEGASARARQRVALGRRLQAHLAGPPAETQAPPPTRAGPPPAPAPLRAPAPTSPRPAEPGPAAPRPAAPRPAAPPRRPPSAVAHPTPPPPPLAPPTEDDPAATLARIQARAAALQAGLIAERAAPTPSAAPTGVAGRLAALRGLSAAAPAPTRAESTLGAGSDHNLTSDHNRTPEPEPPRAPGVAHDRLAVWRAAAERRHQALGAALPGTLQTTPAGGTWRLRVPRRDDHRHGDHRLGATRAEAARWAPLLTGDAALTDFDPARALYFDLETTGLGHAHTLPFLIGAAHGHPGGFTLEQWLLREPDEEPAALLALAERVAEADWLVSFNGRGFDAPVLSARYRAHGLPDPFAPGAAPPHLDLLLLSRRLLAEHLPNCRLATVEVHHLGFVRHDDVPGHAVPARYTAWLAEGDPAVLVDVVRHNADDIWSLITLLGVLLRRVAEAPSLVLRAPVAALRVAKAAEKLAPPHARAIYEAAATFPHTAEAGAAGLARIERRAARVAPFPRPRRRAAEDPGRTSR